MKIAVVIPALDEAAEIVGAIESASAPEVEIVVVDGGSRDDTRERARAAAARVLESDPGRARQLQAGSRATTAEVVLFLHADTRLPGGWVLGVQRALDDPLVSGGAFRFRFERGGSGRRARLLGCLEWGVRLRVALFGLPYGDQALFVRRAVLEAMGGVPNALVMEDLDLVREMKRRGRLVVLALPATTSARRYLARGVLRTAARHAVAAVGWSLGADRARLAGWLQR